LDTAPGGWLTMLATKAEEAACRLILVDPRKYKPSQTDPVDGSMRKKPLSERTHILPDGQVIGRDQAAAWVLWNIGQRILGEERARAATLETDTDIARARSAAVVHLIARNEHRERIAVLNKVRDELAAIWRNIDVQHDERNKSRAR
jgi:hypothetical protein